MGLTNLGVNMLVGLFAIILHYSFTYLGLSITEGSKTAILKQLGTLFYDGIRDCHLN